MVLPPPASERSPKVRKHLSADGLHGIVRSAFEEIEDHRGPRATIPLADALMSAFAMFSLKDPSLLAFDNRRQDENMKNLYLIGMVPSDTSMREIVDLVEPGALRPVFSHVFRHFQRGKGLEGFVFYKNNYLLALDGTGYYSSQSVHCGSCMQKVIHLVARRTGVV